jgi:hypothetical protein
MFMTKVALELAGVEEMLSRYGEIESLQEEVRGHVSAIQELFAKIARTVSGGRVGPRRGRKPGAGRPAKVGRPRGRPPKKKRAKRGALRAAIHKLLSGGKSLRPSEIVAALPRIGYHTASDPKVFYNTVYLALKSDKGIEKTQQGFRLKK